MQKMELIINYGDNENIEKLTIKQNYSGKVLDDELVQICREKRVQPQMYIWSV